MLSSLVIFPPGPPVFPGPWLARWPSDVQVKGFFVFLVSACCRRGCCGSFLDGCVYPFHVMVPGNVGSGHWVTPGGEDVLEGYACHSESVNSHVHTREVSAYPQQWVAAFW